MNRFNLFLTIIAATAAVSCGNSSRRTNTEPAEPKFEITYPFTIDLSKEYPKEKISLQEVCGEMEYIALETKREYLISGVNDNAVIVTPNDIFYNNAFQILRFSRDGKFLNQVCRQGRGPGEVLSALSWFTNDNTQEVFVHDGLSQQISVFDYSGKLKRRFKSLNYRDVNLLNDSLLVAVRGEILPLKKHQIEYNFSPYYVISAKDGSVVDTLFPPRDWLTIISGYKFITHPISSIRNNDGLILSDFHMDTTYLMKPDGSLEPRFIKTPYLANLAEEEKLYLCAAFETDSTAYFLKSSHDILLNERFVFHGLRVDKFSGDIYNTTLFNADIKDYADNRLIYVVIKQEPFCMPYEAMQLIELRDAGKLSGKLAEVAAGLTEEDNPVIMIQK